MMSIFIGQGSEKNVENSSELTIFFQLFRYFLGDDWLSSVNKNFRTAIPRKNVKKRFYATIFGNDHGSCS